MVKVTDVYSNFQQYFSGLSKPPICRKSLTNFTST